MELGTRKLKVYVISLVVMMVVSVFMLMVVSVCSYMYKWYADKALIGITITYIFSGFSGGVVMKFQEGSVRSRKGKKKSGEDVVKHDKSIAKKMQEAIFLGSIFMLFLIVISVLAIQNPFELSSRMLMIWMLLIGSACLGRIL